MSRDRELSSRKTKRKEEGTVPPAPETAGAPVPIFSMELPEGVFTNSHKNRSAQPKNNAEPVPSESSEKQSEKPLKEEKKKQNQKEKTEEKKQEKKEENRNKEKEKEKKEKKKIQLPSFSFAGKIKETAKKATEKKQKEDKAGTEFPIAEEKQKAPEKSDDTILAWLVSIILCNIPVVDIIYFIVCAAKPVKSRKNWALASLIIACIRIAIIIGTVAFILSRSEKDLYNFFYSLSGSL